MILDFVDVSVYQGDIDWSAVTVPAIIKATEGSTFTDPRFFRNRDGARAAGKCLGFYHFLASTSPGDAQAHHFLDTVRPLDGELLCLDWETDSIGVRPDPQQAADWVATVRARGYGDAIRLYGNEWLAAYANEWGVPFWCAWYGNAEQQVLQRDAVAWQWSSSEFTAGIPNRVDANKVLDAERWVGDTMPTPEEIWNHPITKGTTTAPAWQWLLYLHDEMTNPELLEARIAETVATDGGVVSGGATPGQVAEEIGRRLREP